VTLPYLTTRSAFSFRRAYGKPEMFMERFAELGVKHVGIADDYGTWGHVPWEKAALAAGLEPLYGARFPLEGEGERRPTFAALGVESRPLYRFSSRPPATETDIIEHPDRSGVIILSGHALKNPDAFDYINLDQRSQIATRAQLKLAADTGKPLILTPFNAYPAPEHRKEYLAWDDSRRTYPSHVMGDDELRAAYWILDEETYSSARRNTFELAERLEGIRLAKAPMIRVEGDLNVIVEEGRQYRLSRDHISEWTQEHQERLEYEMGLIKEKGYESYFLVVGDMVRWAKDNNILVGPGRGSSAGSLVCYLTRITEVDPLVHGLIFERFIDINRSDLPDIDIDFSDRQRHRVFEYIENKYGKDNVARLGNISRLQSRSVIHHVTKKMGIPAGEGYRVMNVLIEHSSGDARYGKGLEDTLNDTQPGRDFMNKFPEAKVMTELEHHPSHTSVHAAGALVSHVPIIDYCTVYEGVAQIDKSAAEYLNLLKIDVLGLRTLGVIEDANCMTAEELYGLKLDDPKVFDVINQKRFAGVFQFEGASQRRVTTQIEIRDFSHIDHLTALARPGPLGGGGTQLYIERFWGKKPVEYIHDSMGAYLDETQGVAVYQEQVMRLVREIGGFDWAKTSIIRKGMSASKGPEFFLQYTEDFIEGAARLGIDRETAQRIFYDMRMMGAWTMNKAHTCSYAIISYWCAYLKAYHGAAYAAALLRNAKDDEQTLETLREFADEGIESVPFDPELSDIDWQYKDNKIIGGFKNIVGVGSVKAAALLEARAKGELTTERLDKLLKKGVKFSDLHPAKTLWREMYDKPWKFNINGEIKEIGDLKDKQDAVVIVRVDKVDRRDENESVRIGRRAGKVWQGQSLFLDVHGTDDSVSRPVILRIRPENWNTFGQKIADNAIVGKDWLLVRGRWLAEFNMIIVKKVRCLTNEEILQ
jgi:DNA polymerase III alpha subunit